MGFFRKYRFALILGVFLLAALAYFSINAGKGPLLQPAGRYLAELTGPVQRGVDSVGDWFGGIWRRYFALVQAAEENEAYVKQVASLRKQLVELGELKQANSRLKDLLGLKEELNYPMVAAEVVGSDPGGHFRTAIIDKGTSQGVEPLMPVVCAQGAVGRVIWASPNYTKLLLLDDPNSGVDVLVQRSRARGVVTGQRGGMLRLKYVIHTDDVGVGDRVLTSGAAGVFPKGILVGTVAKVTKKETGAFQRVEVKPVVDFSRLEEVMVILHRRELED